MKVKILLTMTMAIFFINACTTTTQLKPIWEEAEFQPKGMDKVVVVAIAKDSLIRKGMEYRFKKELMEMGVNALTSYELIPMNKPINEAGFSNRLSNNNISGIITVRKALNENLSSLEADRTKTDQNRKGFYDYYRQVFELSNSPQFTIRDRIFNIECNLFNAKDGRLIWSGLFIKKHPKKLSDISDSMGKTIGQKFIEKGYLKSK